MYMNIIATLFFIVTTIGFGMTTMTPWQLFQQMCPYLGVQNPQCMAFNTQQQPQQQQPQTPMPQPFPNQPQTMQPQQQGQGQPQPGQNGLSREAPIPPGAPGAPIGDPLPYIPVTGNPTT